MLLGVRTGIAGMIPRSGAGCFGAVAGAVVSTSLENIETTAALEVVSLLSLDLVIFWPLFSSAPEIPR